MRRPGTKGVQGTLFAAAVIAGLSGVGCSSGSSGSSGSEPVTCATSADCPQGRVCQGGLCVPGQAGPDASTPDVTTGSPDVSVAPDVPAAPDVPDSGATDTGVDAADATDTAGFDVLGPAPDTGADIVEDAGLTDTGEPTVCTAHEQCLGLRLCSDDGQCVEPPLCTHDIDCDGARVCDHGQCADVPSVCAESSDCANGVCNAVHLCADAVSCATGNECVSGLCDAGVCVECQGDSDCEGASTCQDGQCVAPDTCGADADCPCGYVCDGGSCHAADVGPDDFEDNDSPAAAASLGEGHVADLTIVGWDDDWFRVEVPAGQGLVVEVSFDDTCGDLDVELYDENATFLLDADRNPWPFAFVTVPARQGARTYLLHVTNPTGAVASYSLDVWMPPKVFCQPDRFDWPSANDDPASAVELGAGTVDLEALSVCAGDEDWFRLKTFGTSNVAASLTYPSADGDLVVEIVDEEGTVAASSSGTGDFESVVATDLAGGTWFVVVHGVDETVHNRYQLQVKSAFSTDCIYDDAEPNDSPQTAATLASSTENLVLCDDPDWYALSIPAGKGLLVTATWFAGPGFERRLYTADGQVLLFDSSESEFDPAINGYHGSAWVEEATENLDVLLALTMADPSYAGPGVPYSLDIEIKDPFCIEDAAEPNDQPEAATPLVGDEIAAKACAGNPDYWSVDLQEGERLSLDVLYDTQHHALVAELVAPDGGTAATVDPVGPAGANLVYTVPAGAAGTYLVKVQSDSATPYTLRAAVWSPLLCSGDDAQEPNDTPLSPAAIDVGVAYDNLVLCAGTTDCFEFTEAGSAKLGLQVEFDTPSLARWTLTDALGQTLVPWSTLANETTVLDAIAGKPGTYAVCLQSTLTTNYTLSIVPLP